MPHTPEQSKRDAALQEAKIYARMIMAREDWRWGRFRFYVQRALKNAPITQRQINNLIVAAGRAKTAWALGMEVL